MLTVETIYCPTCEGEIFSGEPQAYYLTLLGDIGTTHEICLPPMGWQRLAYEDVIRLGRARYAATRHQYTDRLSPLISLVPQTPIVLPGSSSDDLATAPLFDPEDIRDPGQPATLVPLVPPIPISPTIPAEVDFSIPGQVNIEAAQDLLGFGLDLDFDANWLNAVEVPDIPDELPIALSAPNDIRLRDMSPEALREYVSECGYERVECYFFLQTVVQVGELRSIEEIETAMWIARAINNLAGESGQQQGKVNYLLDAVRYKTPAALQQEMMEAMMYSDQARERRALAIVTEMDMIKAETEGYARGSMAVAD